MTGLIAWIILPTPATGQLVPFDPQPSREETIPTITSAAPSSQSTDVLRGPLLDRAIDRSEYLLGPGDVVTLSIVGFRSLIHTLQVSPEQTVVIPEVGLVRVGGLSIERAEVEVARAVRRVHRDVQISLTLATVRSFKIYVLGAVDNPGIREASAVTRVSEVAPHTDARGIIHRNIIVRRSTGQESRVDLAKFLRLGDLSQNPVLQEGDIVQVPVIDETVSVTGSVAFPSTYAYREGETVADLLHLATAGSGFMAAAADTVRLMRWEGAAGEAVIRIPRDAAMGEAGRSIPLLPFDALFLSRIGRFGEVTTATVDGEVARPGTYPITPDVTTVAELVEMAGGFTSQGSVLDAVLRRTPVLTPRDSIVSLERMPPELLSRNDMRVLQVTSRADQGTVVVDFSRITESAGDAMAITLESGDHLFVPEQRFEVSVLGAVIQPGILPFSPSRTVEEYVFAAGGFTQEASRGDVMILKSRTGTRLEARKDTTLQPGDRIIVPFRQRLTFWERVQSAQGVLSTVASLAVAIIGMQQLIDTLVN